MSAPKISTTPIEGEWTFDRWTLLEANLQGREGKYNQEGDRHFHMILPDDRVKELESAGFNVKFSPFYGGIYTLKVKIDARQKMPWVSTPLVIVGYPWTHEERSGVLAFLKYTPLIQKEQEDE